VGPAWIQTYLSVPELADQLRPARPTWALNSDDAIRRWLSDRSRRTGRSEQLSELCRSLLDATADGDRLWRESSRKAIVDFLLDQPDSQRLTESSPPPWSRSSTASTTLER
jgi:hypothetical protein